MANENSKVCFCPNCQQPAIRIDNEITCGTCDATFTITKKDGAKVKQLGRIERIEQDLDELKKIVLPGQEPEPEPEPDPEPEPEQDPEPKAKPDDDEVWRK